LVKIINNPELRAKGRLARRGYSDEEYGKILENSNRFGGVTVLKKRSFRKNSLRDYIKTGSC